jgi:hypothetical protein
MEPLVVPIIPTVMEMSSFSKAVAPTGNPDADPILTLPPIILIFMATL